MAINKQYSIKINDTPKTKTIVIKVNEGLQSYSFVKPEGRVMLKPQKYIKGVDGLQISLMFLPLIDFVEIDLYTSLHHPALKTVKIAKFT